MPNYKVTDPKTGRSLKLTGDAPPDEYELAQIFSTYKSNNKMSFKERAFEAIQPTGKIFKEAGIKTNRRSALKDAAGAIEGATLGIPRAVIETGLSKITGEPVHMERGSKLGQLLGSVLGAGKVYKLAKALPGLAKSTIRAGAVTGGILSQTPQYTEPDTPLSERVYRGVAGTAMGAAIPAGFKIAAKVPGTALRFLSNAPTIHTKDLGNILKRTGKKAFSGSIDRPGYIGETLVPKVSKLFIENIEQTDPKTLSRIKIPQKNIQDALNVKRKYSLKGVPRSQEASELFDKTISEADPDIIINIKSFKGKVGGLLKKFGAIDERGRPVPGIIKDNRVLGGLLNMYNSLKKRVALNSSDKIRRLVTRQPTSRQALDYQLRTGTKALAKKDLFMLRKISENPDSLDKAQWLRTKLGLKNLLTGDNESDRIVYQIISHLDDAAAKSGIPGLQKAKDIFRASKGLEKAFNRIDDPDLAGTIQSKLLSARNSENVAQRKYIEEIVGGKKAKEILDLIKLNDTLVSPGKLGRPAGSGLYTEVRKIGRRAVRYLAEKRAPKEPLPDTREQIIESVFKKK
ncbi:MAG: hypothetical protein U1C56_01740 [Candidatus Curtissbacteria bacterium]|nr:hypothetical protein [Candidatus Curtissbacteria bacterium]